jgi:hypothetical protein
VEHFWHEINGYFTFEDFYAYVATEPGGIGHHWHGVEVGVYTGQSAAFLCVEMLHQHRPGVATLDLVDFEMTKHRARENLARLDGEGVVGRFLEMGSTGAAELYDDASLDMVFVDADHRYECVRSDIEAWRSKVRSGGLLCGHDYKVWPGFGVIEAVTEAFPRVEIWRGKKGMGDEQMKPHYWPCWAVRMP